MKLFNITFDLDDKATRLVPCIPDSAADDEDKTIERVCLTDSIENCLQAIAVGNREVKSGQRFILRTITISENNINLVKPKQLKKEGKVPDAIENQEYWYLKPIDCTSETFEIESFNYEYTIAWSCVTVQQCRDIINKHTKNIDKPEILEKYTEAPVLYQIFNTWAFEHKLFNIADDVWEELITIPWAQKTKISNLMVKSIQ